MFRLGRSFVLVFLEKGVWSGFFGKRGLVDSIKVFFFLISIIVILKEKIRSCILVFSF